MSDTKEIIEKSIAAFKAKEEATIIGELSRLSHEGHILIVQLAPTVEKTDEGILLKGALKITLPKYEKLKAENENLKMICRRLSAAKSIESRDKIKDQCLHLFEGNPLRDEVLG